MTQNQLIDKIGDYTRNLLQVRLNNTPGDAWVEFGEGKKNKLLALIFDMVIGKHGSPIDIPTLNEFMQAHGVKKEDGRPEWEDEETETIKAPATNEGSTSVKDTGSKKEEWDGVEVNVKTVEEKPKRGRKPRAKKPE